MRSFVLLSGGMDSFITYRTFRPDATPVYVRTGSRYEEHDWACARRIDPDVRFLWLPVLWELPSGVVPHRNILLLAHVANQLNAEEVIVSAPRGELIWDQQRAFHRACERVLRGVRISNPLRRMTKTQAVRAYLRSGGDVAALLETRSCYSTEKEQCGRCPACVKRWVALANNGLSEHYTHDPRVYARELARSGGWKDYLRYGARPMWEAWKASRV